MRHRRLHLLFLVLISLFFTLCLANSQASAQEPQAIKAKDILVGETGNKVNHEWFPVAFSLAFSEAPVVVAGMQTAVGGDPAGVRIGFLTTGQMEIKVEEEDSTRDGVTHAKENVGYFALPAGLIVNEDGNVIGEAGRTTAGHAGDVEEDWHLVVFGRSYATPPIVIISTNLISRTLDPAHLRVKNVTTRSFEFMIEEWDYLDGSHGLENIGYIAMERGVHSLSDGRQIVAGSLLTNMTSADGSDSWENVSFTQSFPGTPSVISQVQTFEGAQPVITRQREISGNGFQLQMQEEKNLNNIHNHETIGYIAIGAKALEAKDILVSKTGDSVNHEWFPVVFPSAFPAAPVVVAGMQTADGGDPAGVRIGFLTTGQMEVKVEEEDSTGDGVTHTKEEVGYIALPAGLIVDEEGGVIGEAGKTTAGRAGDIEEDWHLVVFRRSYTTPPIVIISTNLISRTLDPAHLRVRNVTTSSFEFMIEEWDYLDGAHGLENIGYIAIERGVHALSDGRQVVSGSLLTNMTSVDGSDSWESVSFPQSFPSTPSVISQVQTFAGAQPVITRQREISGNGFQLQMQEEKNLNNIHNYETIGYIAISVSPAQPHPGLDVVDPLTITAMQTGNLIHNVDHHWHAVNFPKPFSLKPVLLTSMQTTEGGDPAGVRSRALTPKGVQVRVEEEDSDEMGVEHLAKERIGLLALPPGVLKDRAGNVIGESGNIVFDSNWKTFNFKNGPYLNPVVFVSVNSVKDGHPAHARVRSVTPTSFECQVEEWNYQDGAHGAEEAGYVVIEKGIHVLGDQRKIAVSSLFTNATSKTNPNWQKPSFGTTFSLIPVVISQIQTASISQTPDGPLQKAVVVRQKEISQTGLWLKMQEEDRNNDIHPHEAIGFMAIGK